MTSFFKPFLIAVVLGIGSCATTHQHSLVFPELYDKEYTAEDGSKWKLEQNTTIPGPGVSMIFTPSEPQPVGMQQKLTFCYMESVIDADQLIGLLQRQGSPTDKKFIEKKIIDANSFTIEFHVPALNRKRFQRVIIKRSVTYWTVYEQESTRPDERLFNHWKNIIAASDVQLKGFDFEVPSLLRPSEYYRPHK